jgi:hypothetical protein
MRLWGPIAAVMLASLVMSPIPWGDSVGSVFGALSFLCEGDWDFDEFPFLYEQTPGGALTPDPLRNVHPSPGGEDLLSFTGLGVKLVHLPVTAVMLFPWTGSTTELTAIRANQVTGLLSCLGILWLCWGAFRRELGQRQARIAVLALFFGTTLWPGCRQTLWSNQAALLGVAGVLWAVCRGRHEGVDRGVALALGVGLGWAVMTRPATLLLCVPLLMALWSERPAEFRRHATSFVLAGLPFLGLFLWDNQLHSGSVWRPPFLEVGSAIATRMDGGNGAFSGGLITGLTGSLFSPARGLLVFSPFLLLAPLGVVANPPGPDRAGPDKLGYALAAGLVGMLLLNANYTDWWGAACWGPRRLMEGLPLAVLLVFRSTTRRPRLGGPLLVLLGLSVAVQSVGFFFYDSGWDAEREPTQHLHMEDGELVYMPRSAAEAVLWDWADGPIPDALRRGLQFGFDARYSLAAGTVVPAPIPACNLLRQVDRYTGE